MFAGTADGTPSLSLSSVIINAAAMELRLSGFTIILMDPGVEPGAVRPPAEAVFFIRSDYAIENRMISIDFSCFRIESGYLVHTVSKSGRFDLHLDTMIGEAVKELIPEIARSIAEHPVEGRTETPVDPIPPVEAGPERKGRFMVAAGFAPFMTTGKAASYFTSGLVPEIYAGYRFQAANSYIGFGLYGATNFFRAQGILLSSENLLISAGPEGRFGLGTDSFLGFFLRFSGGVTLFMMNRNNEGYQSTPIPYVSGGIGTTVDIGRNGGIQFGANYTSYFEESVAITGFLPSAGIYFLF